MLVHPDFRLAQAQATPTQAHALLDVFQRTYAAQGGGSLLEEVRLFDVYTGAQAGEGNKSLAYTLRFRAPDRTLTDEEVTAARDAAVAEAGRRVGAVLRGTS